jgi:hypothetical protein
MQWSSALYICCGKACNQYTSEDNIPLPPVSSISLSYKHINVVMNLKYDKEDSKYKLGHDPERSTIIDATLPKSRN